MEMLVLRRRVGQTIVLNGNIQVTILKNKGRSVAIGVTAPNNVEIVRQEIIEAQVRYEAEVSERLCHE
jgi:carbon storage regulator